MAHLTRIFSKAAQAQGLVLVHSNYVARRYRSQNQIMSLKSNYDKSLFNNDIDYRSYSIPYEKRKINEESTNKFGRREEFYPTIDPNLCKNVRSVVGVSVTPYSVGWSNIHLEQKTLLDFGSVVLSPNNFENSFKPNSVLKLARAILGVLPEGDLYIFENYRSKVDRKSMSSNILEIQLLSMLTVLLSNSDYDDKNMERVFFQNSSVIDYLYELRIKNERISAGQKLQRLLNDGVSIGKDKVTEEVVADFGCVKLNIKLDFLNIIFSSHPLRRDASAIAFFLALSFIELNKTDTSISLQ